VRRWRLHAAIVGATRNALAAIVNAGFITGREGKNAESTTKRLSTS
jgi:hypothetical protein